MKNLIHTLATFILAAACVVITAGAAYSQTAKTTDVPHVISYQGMLTDNAGAPIADGAYTVTVRLYSDAAGTQKVYEDAFTAQTLNGVFSIQLGSGATALPIAAMSAPLWLGVQPAGGDEMRPLSPMTASPYALGIPNGSVTAEKMGTPYVSGIYVNGELATGNNGALNIMGANGALQFDATTNTLTLGATTASGIVGDGKGGGDKIQFTGNLSYNPPLYIATPGGPSTIDFGEQAGTGPASGDILIGQGTSSDPVFETKATIDNSTGNFSTQGYINTTNTTFYYEIGGNTVLQNPGTENIYAGVLSGYSSSGSRNTGIGYSALYSTTSAGNDNTAVGETALENNNAGYQNTAIGWAAIWNASGGNNNTATGYTALAEETGGFNTGIGANVMAGASTSGWSNTAAGSNALYAVTTGYKNTAVGDSALAKITTGHGNTAVGYGADAGSNSLTNATAIGNGAIVNASNSMQLGSTAVTSVATAGTLQTGETSASTAGSLIFNDGTASGYTTTFTIGSQSGNIAYTLPVSAGAGVVGYALTYGASGALAWTNIPGVGGAVTTDATLQGNGVIGNPLEIALGNTNTWTATQTFPTTAAQGNALANSLNNLTSTTISPADLTAGSSNTFLTTNNSGVIGFNALDVDGTTLQGDGSHTALAINLGHANTWTTTQTFPTTAAQGNALANSLNNLTSTTISPADLTAGSSNTFLTTNNSGVVGFNALDVDGTTLQGDGSHTALAINLAHSNTWTAKQIFAPSSTSVTGVVVEQASSGTVDIFDVTSNGASTTYLDVDNSGNVNINTNSANTTTIGETGANASSTVINIGNTGNLTLGNAHTGSAAYLLALDGSNNVIYTTTAAGGGIATLSVNAPVTSTGGVNPTLGLGVVGVANGGTGQSTLGANGVLIGEGTNPVDVTGAGTSGQALISNGAGNDPTFQSYTQTMYSPGCPSSIATPNIEYVSLTNNGSFINGDVAGDGYRTVMPTSGTMKNLYIVCANAPGVGKTYTFTIYKNGIAQSVSASVTGTGKTGSDVTHSFTFSAADEISIQITVPGGAANLSSWDGGVQAITP